MLVGGFHTWVNFRPRSTSAMLCGLKIAQIGTLVQIDPYQSVRTLYGKLLSGCAMYPKRIRVNLTQSVIPVTSTAAYP